MVILLSNGFDIPRWNEEQFVFIEQKLNKRRLHRYFVKLDGFKLGKIKIQSWFWLYSGNLGNADSDPFYPFVNA